MTNLFRGTESTFSITLLARGSIDCSKHKCQRHGGLPNVIHGGRSRQRSCSGGIERALVPAVWSLARAHAEEAVSGHRLRVDRPRAREQFTQRPARRRWAQSTLKHQGHTRAEGQRDFHVGALEYDGDRQWRLVTQRR